MKNELSVRIRTGAMIVIVMLAFLIPGYKLPFIPLILFFVISYFSAVEKGRAFNRRMPGLNINEPAVATILLVAIIFFSIPSGWFVYGIPENSAALAIPIVTPHLITTYALSLLVLSFVWILIGALVKGIERLPYSLFEILVIVSSSIPLAAIVTLFYGVPFAFYWVLLAVFTPWISDSFAYFVGSFFGQRKMAVKISGKKTWEGTLGGIVGSLIFYLPYFTLVLAPKLELSTGSAIALAIISGIVMSLISTAGDLFASAIKRWCRIKDFGNILPGHGGISDRFDSMSWTMPAVLLLAILSNKL